MKGLEHFRRIYIAESPCHHRIKYGKNLGLFILLIMVFTLSPKVHKYHSHNLERIKNEPKHLNMGKDKPSPWVKTMEAPLIPIRGTLNGSCFLTS